jgi:hypothetical protein
MHLTSKESTTTMCPWIQSTPTSLVKKIILREFLSYARIEEAILLIQTLMET